MKKVNERERVDSLRADPGTGERTRGEGLGFVGFVLVPLSPFLLDCQVER